MAYSYCAAGGACRYYYFILYILYSYCAAGGACRYFITLYFIYFTPAALWDRDYEVRSTLQAKDSFLQHAPPAAQQV